MSDEIKLAVLGSEPVAVCDLDDGCITCGDVAVTLQVVEVGAHDARCVDEHGNVEVVATELVGPLVAGDLVLVHARVALQRLAGGDEA